MLLRVGFGGERVRNPELGRTTDQPDCNKRTMTGFQVLLCYT